MANRILLFIVRAALLLTLIVSTYLATASGPVAAGGINDKLAHLIGFYLLALLADLSFPRRRFDLYKILPLMGYGLLIEIIQFFLPYRSFSTLDMVADGAGLMLYSLTILLLKRSPFRASRWAFIHRQ